MFNRNDYGRNRGRGPYDRAPANQRIPCEVRDCGNFRWWTSKYCRLHSTYNKYYGHPLARGFTKKDLRPYLDEVRRMFAAHEQHEGLHEAEKKMATCLEPGIEPLTKKLRGPQGARRLLWFELSRLKHAGVTPRQALEAYCATSILTQEQPRRFPTQATVQHAFANAVYRLAPMRHTSRWRQNGKRICRPKPPGSGPILLLAQRFNECRELVRFAGNLHAVYEQRRQKDNAEKTRIFTAIDTPFSLVVSEPPKIKRKPGRPKKTVSIANDAAPAVEPIMPAVTPAARVVFVTDPGPRPHYRTSGDLALIEAWQRRHNAWQDYLKSQQQEKVS